VAAEEHEDRTEQPSARRLHQAWEEGKVPLGHDAPLVVGLGAAALALVLVAPTLRQGLVRLLAEAAGGVDRARFDTLPGLAGGPVLAALAVCSAAAVAATAAVVAQTRGGLWPHLALPDLTRLWQAGRLNLFRKELWIDLGVALVKVLALGWAAWTVIRADFLALPGMLGAAPGDQLSATTGILWRTALRLILAAAVLAGLDLAIQRMRFTARMRMTREETKREAKEDEGDPLLRGRRRKRHRDLSRGRAALEVPRADALVVNPTHVAVALRYRKGEGRAPRVTAKGKGVLAEYMRELARENAVPIVQDVPLARLLYRKVKVGGEIPAATYQAVAAVLAFVYRLTGRAPQPGARP
jgi:flagellar biosynthesis protein FlhB